VAGSERMDVDILMLGPRMPTIADGIERHLILHRPDDASDPEAAIDTLAPKIRGLALSYGHRRIGPELFDRLPKLEIIANFGVGYDHVDAAAAGSRGLIVTNTPDVLNEEVADTAIGLLLATVRQLPQADRYLREGRWLEKPFPLTATLRDRTVGIVGLGRIGKAIARRIESFGLPIAYFGRNRQADVPYPYYANLVEMARAVDVIIVITPGGAGTKHLINADVLQALGPEGILINVARGSVVDERALIEALRSRTILSAGLDVFEHEPQVPPELIAMDHVVLLPHVGSASVHCRNAMGQLVVDNLVSWFSGRGPLTPVAETPWTGRAA
jgi:lactate dehydrogenase-like 2-hydroxyacid dehydrogenase